MVEKIPTYIGWYQPHAPVDWTGEVLDLKTGESVKEPSMTKQSHKEECDINNIIKQYQVTGIVAHISEKAASGAYVDLPDPLDFQQSLNLVMEAQASFDSLPSSVRSRFENDPTRFLEFMQNPENQEEMISLGLAKDTRPAPAPSQPELTPPKPVEAPKAS